MGWLEEHWPPNSIEASSFIYSLIKMHYQRAHNIIQIIHSFLYTILIITNDAGFIVNLEYIIIIIIKNLLLIIKWNNQTYFNIQRKILKTEKTSMRRSIWIYLKFLCQNSTKILENSVSGFICSNCCIFLQFSKTFEIKIQGSVHKKWN